MVTRLNDPCLEIVFFFYFIVMLLFIFLGVGMFRIIGDKSVFPRLETWQSICTFYRMCYLKILVAQLIYEYELHYYIVTILNFGCFVMTLCRGMRY